MNLPAIFSLISAAILGLLPVLILFGRRRMQRRNRAADLAARETGGSRQAGGPLAPEEARESAARSGLGTASNRQAGESPILDRLVRRNREEVADERAGVATTWWKEARPTATGATSRELRDAALIAGAEPGEGVPGGLAAFGEGRDGDSLRPARTDDPGRRARRATGVRLEERLARLSPLQRAVVYGEILGAPAALREPGRDDAR